MKCIPKSAETIPSINASDAQWIQWHKLLKKETGSKNANILFLRAWEKRKNEGLLGSSANTSTLRDYLATQNIDVRPDGVFAYPISTIESIEGAIETSFGVGKWVFIILAVIILVPVTLLLINIARNPRLLIDGFKTYATRGIA